MGHAVTGSISWHDLSIDDAVAVRDFYREVVGWTTSDVSMGDYADFSMHDGEGNVVAGVCHARGPNAGLPPQWLMYVTVDDLEASLAACKRLEGTVIDGPRSLGNDRMCVVRDPAGAVMALYQPGGEQPGPPV